MLKISKLAARDYYNEWQISGCFIIALAAVLGPMLVLFGLKYGIVGTMIKELVDEPRNREIRPINSGRYDAEWFSKARKRSDVEFVSPRTRNIAATIQLKSKTAPRILSVELIPTAQRDPLLPDFDIPNTGSDWLILSDSAAKKLAVKSGDTIDGSISRRYRNISQRIHLPLKILAVAPAGAFNREGAFSSLSLLEALEDYRDGHAVPEFGWSGDNPDGPGYYAGFRLFARTIYDVAKLKTWFNDQGIEVRTRAHDIEIVQRMDQNLSTIYWAIAIIGLAGFSLSLGASLWANIDRKRKELSVLRLVGFETLEVIWFPMIQSLFTALVGWLLAVVIYHLTSLGINKIITSQLDPDKGVCFLLPSHYLMSLALTCVAALIAALLAGFRSARIEPADGLREL